MAWVAVHCCLPQPVPVLHEVSKDWSQLQGLRLPQQMNAGSLTKEALVAEAGNQAVTEHAVHGCSCMLLLSAVCIMGIGMWHGDCKNKQALSLPCSERLNDMESHVALEEPTMESIGVHNVACSLQ